MSELYIPIERPTRNLVNGRFLKGHTPHNNIDMKTIKDLTIQVTYTVGLGNVEVPDEVYNALSQCYDDGGNVPMSDICTINGEPELACASEWISDNIRESDAMDWEYEITEFEEE